MMAAEIYRRQEGWKNAQLLHVKVDYFLES